MIKIIIQTARPTANPAMLNGIVIPVTDQTSECGFEIVFKDK
jgi:hypothetical protein